MDKFKSPAPLPTPHQAEGLTILMEEAFEILPFVGGRASKAVRFGLDEVQPGQALTNKQRLSIECGDFAAVMDLLVEAGAIDGRLMNEAIFNKRAKLRKFLQFDPD